MEPALKSDYRLRLPEIVAALKQFDLLVENDAQLETPLTGFVSDSRQTSESVAFVAYRGVSTDLHTYISQVRAKGCPLVIGELGKDQIEGAGPYLQVKNGRAAWSVLCAALYGNPQEHLKIAAVSGTNGKTSTVWLLREMFRQANIPCLAIGTLGAFTHEMCFRTQHTTPDPPLFYQLLAYAVEAMIPYCALEASSHASVQQKLLPLRFSSFAITSFSRDHLDFHKTEDEYWKAKWSFVSSNCDAATRLAFGPGILNRVGNDISSNDFWSYGPENSASRPRAAKELCYTSQINTEGLTDLTLTPSAGSNNPSLTGKTSLFAPFALQNFCAAALAFEKLVGKWPDPGTWRNLSQVPGRLELIVSASPGPKVVVDYAHTPDALEKALVATCELRADTQKLWVVFGCGGDRDRGKRAQMGAVAAKWADNIIVTSDNPRSEEPQSIIAGIVEGIPKTHGHTLIEADRGAAINHAIKQASPDDVVLIAGKGHEDYQIIGETTHPFDDRKCAAAALANR